MVSRSAIALIASLMLHGCGEPEATGPITRERLQQLITSLERPTVVLFWAEWSRPSVELLPAAGELASEYEGRGVEWITVGLGEPLSQEARALLRGFPATASHVTLGEEPPFVLSRYGLSDVPAALVYSPSGELLLTLDAAERQPLTPADLADAIESALAPSD